ncbi:hypothetical protein SDC9_189347 [bioreactor metagenome]|uniref:Uncharacterized protein n=1 Tax=bioreactor metagenome TaxID=1076179 RepID=A0A645HTJ9_9ZZZZ
MEYQAQQRRQRVHVVHISDDEYHRRPGGDVRHLDSGVAGEEGPHEIAAPQHKSRAAWHDAVMFLSSPGDVQQAELLRQRDRDRRSYQSPEEGQEREQIY